jgi:hypothetical protein
VKKIGLRVLSIALPIIVVVLFPAIYFANEGLKAILPDIMGDIHEVIYTPIGVLTKLQPILTQSNPAHYFNSILLILVYITFLIGFISASIFLYLYFKNRNEEEPTEEPINVENHPRFRDYCTKELAHALNLLEKNGVAKGLINTKVTSFMATFEYAAREIFKLEDDECRSFWIVSNKDKYDILTLDGKPPTEHERNIIGMGIERNIVRVPYPDVKGRYPEFASSPIEQFLLVRNFGNLKLAFAFSIHRNHTINNYNMQEFNMLTSYLLLLGFHEDFTFRLRKLDKTS